MHTPITSGEDVVHYPAIIATLRSTQDDYRLQIATLLKCLNAIQAEMRHEFVDRQSVLAEIESARAFISASRAFRQLCAEEDAALDQRKYETELRD